MPGHRITVSRPGKAFPDGFLVLITALHLVLTECLGSLNTTCLLKSQNKDRRVGEPVGEVARR